MKAIFGLAFLWAGLMSVAACGDDDACDPACGEGQVCDAGPDGEMGCFCSVDANTGCAPGLECQVVEGEGPGCFCSPRAQSGCGEGLVCEEVDGSNSNCFPPVTVRGRVFDLATGDAVEGALVVARDANNAAMSNVAETDVNGEYDLTVLTRRTRDGQLLETFVTLRADAAGYVTYPTAPRFAVPFDVAKASGNPPALESSAADIALIALPDTAGLGSISGTVVTHAPRGTLVVAGSATGVADFDGGYTIFNVPAGDVVVSGYLAGLQLDSESANVKSGEEAAPVDLRATGEATSVVSGKIEIVNPGNGDDTSVILVVESTFDDATAAGQSPPGLRAYPVGGAFEIPGVPDGDYVVLAAFENDFLVRDPDTSIGGTDIVHISVAGKSFDIAEGFKVTGSLDVVSPDAEEVVSGVPSFVFSDDSGEDHYEIRVYDVLGNLNWEKTDVPGVSGGATVTVPYEGPGLEPGLLYQFRATSIKNNGTPIAITEDLRGVFLYQ